jgi:hypothetical protein
MRGVFAYVRVGGGKTLIACLMGTVLRARQTLVFTRAPLVDDMMREYRLVAIPHFQTYGNTTAISYDMLSEDTSTALLRTYYERFGDELAIVCDEADALANLTASRTIRIARFLKAHPTVPFCMMTGTIQRNSVKNYAHLAEWALRGASPVVSPKSAAELDALAACIDVKGKPGEREWGYGHELVKWAFPAQNFHNKDGFTVPFHLLDTEERRLVVQCANRERIRSAKGVVFSDAETAEDYKGEVRVCEWHIDTPDVVENALYELEAGGVKPNGDACVTAAEQWFTGVCLSFGFFYHWVWPNNEPDEQWLEARKQWSKYWRSEIKNYADEYYDSELLIRNAVLADPRHPGNEALRPWLEQSRKRWNGQPHPPTRDVWLSRFAVDAVARWARAQPQPAIVFYQTDAMEKALRAVGFETFGRGTDVQSIEKPRTIAASWRVHGIGKRLHRYNRALVTEAPKSGSLIEQLIGRMARPKQLSPFVDYTFPLHTGPLVSNWAQTLKENASTQTLADFKFNLTRAIMRTEHG